MHVGSLPDMLTSIGIRRDNMLPSLAFDASIWGVAV
jgi:hypothetical protein